jgi:hypothetical protein
MVRHRTFLWRWAAGRTLSIDNFCVRGDGDASDFRPPRTTSAFTRVSEACRSTRFTFVDVDRVRRVELDLHVAAELLRAAHDRVEIGALVVVGLDDVRVAAGLEIMDGVVANDRPIGCRDVGGSAVGNGSAGPRPTL